MAASRHTSCVCLLAEAYGRTGQPSKGFDVLASLGREQRETFFAPEIHRLEGELLVQANGQARSEAEQKFWYALDLAQSRSEMSLALRAATSLARFLEADRNRRADGRAVLADIYERFTEGQETGDLRAAKALLEKLT